jgi:hypothetical protein
MDYRYLPLLIIVIITLHLLDKFYIYFTPYIFSSPNSKLNQFLFILYFKQFLANYISAVTCYLADIITIIIIIPAKCVIIIYTYSRHF